jgi:hypothetical protein
MRTLLVLAAAVGLPLAALAQPVADDGKSTVVSELAVEAGKAADCPPGTGHRLNAINKYFDAPPDTKGKRTEESAGTRAIVLMLVAADKGAPVDYTHIGPALAKLIMEQEAHTRPSKVCQGAFKSIRFLHVSQADWDDFEVDYSNGVLEWAVKPLDSRQVTDGTASWYFYPQPATRQFEDWLKSIERGRPNYADLAPDPASKLQAQWPALQKSLKDWGKLNGFRFLRQDDGGAYVFLATYDHHEVVWTASLSNADGKFAALTYDEKAG